MMNNDWNNFFAGLMFGVVVVCMSLGWYAIFTNQHLCVMQP